MNSLKKKRCLICDVFAVTTVKFNGKPTCLSCLDKLYVKPPKPPKQIKTTNGIYKRPTKTRI